MPYPFRDRAGVARTRRQPTWETGAELSVFRSTLFGQGAKAARRGETDWMRIETLRGDITTEQVDAIVNAANSALLGGGGVDGAIHRAAGPDLLAQCRQVRAEQWPDGLPVGEAVATGTGRLPARWVIHTVGPNRHAGQTDPDLLASCFRRSLEVAAEVGARTVAFPAISAGVYGWAADEVARIAVTTVRHTTGGGYVTGLGNRTQGSAVGIELVRFVLFSEELLAVFRTAART
jgi:O-acetyl-ADP-ribose deacetylase (regulator of RNase III)